jgi:phospholipid/cholesterol/gamma-HCH transport system permease protein
MGQGWVRLARQGETRIVLAGGDWQLASLVALDRELAGVAHEICGASAPSRALRLQLADINGLDSAGAWLLARTADQLTGQGIPVAIEGASRKHQALLDLVRGSGARVPEAIPHPRHLPDMVEKLGRATVGIGREAALLLSFFGRILAAIGGTIAHPRRLRGAALVHQLQLVGLEAMPIVGLLSFLIGVVLAYQGADQLRRFGAEIFTINLLGVSVLRELGILLTAIIVAGRSGSAFTAQIGAMQVNEEVDALRTIGLDPIEVLVLPRLLALVLALPLLAFYASMMAILGGGLMIVTGLDIPLPQFLHQLAGAVPPRTLWIGLAKAPVFAFLIAMVGCFQGLRVSRSAESVGLLTTKSVVVSIFLVILVDALFSILFARLGL